MSRGQFEPRARGRRRKRRGQCGVGGTATRRSVLALGGAAIGSVAGCTDAGSAGNGTASDGPTIVVRDATVSETAVTTEESLDVRATVENEGEESGTFHAQLRVDGVIVDTQAVSVGAGETESVTFDGSFGEPGEYEVHVNDTPAGTVRVERPPPTFELVETDASGASALVGEEYEVRVTVANTGGREGTIRLGLRADRRTVAVGDATVEAGAEATVTLIGTFDAPGSYDLAIREEGIDPPESRVAFGEQRLGTVVVEQPATFEVVGTATSETALDVGEELTVRARIENVGDRPGTATATLEADGEAIATREGEIEAGEGATARFTVTFDRRGRRTLAVNGTRVGAVYVRECTVEVAETITVDSRSTETYAFDLDEYETLTVLARTRSGVDPTLAVVGPDGPLIEGESGERVRRTVEAAEAGRYEVGLENGALLPWNDGTWAVDIEVCRW